ncbi:hypothetical protein GALL_479650 [mine drainage metagenome]|uniref:Uncharacterized protein n=1 Tax=mine drainage metagenome TaxID=410659 RepID=A0A1J5PI15_9ZZZZ
MGRQIIVRTVKNVITKITQSSLLSKRFNTQISSSKHWGPTDNTPQMRAILLGASDSRSLWHPVKHTATTQITHAFNASCAW